MSGAAVVILACAVFLALRIDDALRRARRSRAIRTRLEEAVR